MKKLLTFLNEKLEITICVFLICFMTVLIFVQVFMRYVMQNSLSWSEELARYVFIWLIYVGISYGAQTYKHIKIDAALMIYPKKVQPYISLVGDLIFLGFALFITITGTDLVYKVAGMNQRSAALNIPLWMVYAAPALGYGLTVFRQTQAIIKRIKEMRAN